MEVKDFFSALSLFSLSSLSIALVSSHRRSRRSLASAPQSRSSSFPAPITLLIGSSAPTDDGSQQKQASTSSCPLAFECVGDRTIAEHA